MTDPSSEADTIQPMDVPYEALWVPGLAHDIERDESLRCGLGWLAEAEESCGRAGRIVMYAKKMAGNAPLLTAAAQRWEFVSPRSRHSYDPGPVLAVWPPDSGVIELAESLSRGYALCVIAGRYDLSAWIKRARATCLIAGFEEPPPEELAPEVRESLDHMLWFDGHNGFVGAGGKEDAIRRLRAIAARADKPAPREIEDHLLASGETDADGARQARRWYEEILRGKRHLDYRGHVIR
jgi:hypothetical protein